MCQATFTTPDLTTFTRVDELGLVVTGQCVLPDRTELACVVADEDRFCHRCGCEGTPRDTTVRRLAHVPIGLTPVTLCVRIKRWRCAHCCHVWRQDMSRAARARSKLSMGALVWALTALVRAHLSMSCIAQALGVSWGCANTAILSEGKRCLIDDPHRLEGVKVLGVDEHAWRHTKKGDKYVTVIIDLTAVRDCTGPARLLDMVEGRSKKVFKEWLEAQDKAFRDGIEIVAMDGFTGFKTAAVEELPAACEVMDPFHVVQLAGDSMDKARQRIQQDTRGHRGRSGEPLYGVRLTLHTGLDLLTDKQRTRLENVFADDKHAVVETTWEVYQRIVAAYRDSDKLRGRTALEKLISTISARVPEELEEVRTLGHTMKRRATDILAYFNHPHTSNGPTEAVNGRLEHLRGIALGFRNLTHYIARSLLEAGGFRPKLHPQM